MSFTAARMSRSICRQSSGRTVLGPLPPPLSRLLKRLSITLALGGHIPVALNALRVRSDVNVDTQALQNSRKKSPFWIGSSP
ncbi:hypothetical protein CC86DRAFT_370174 [Ophiobolus disseminans]|uniref:Uncharacterized protein n=1 Tax=Ophiobolus disseminans TaxID=1469910 RepID=A0A6A7A1C4_9PLEO|nr:hypothetical protein CC86DRAFT_370174 [Ophiobolus disseminans]